MKSVVFRITLSIVMLVIFGHFSDAKPAGGQVTKVEVFATPGYFEGCTNSIKVVTFTAFVTTSGPCSASYKWLRSDNAIDNNSNSLVFTAAGTKKITTTWTMSVANYAGWEAVQFTQPNTITSNKAPFNIYCCKQTPDNSCINNPYTLTTCALDLLTTFKNLVKNVGTKNCYPNGSLNISSAMHAECYSNTPGVTGIVTYTAFYIPIDSVFRVIWGSADNNNLAYVYYGACPPNPIVFPAVSENHVFDAFLIPIDEYKVTPAAVKADYFQLRKKAIQPVAMADLTGWYFEPKTGYTAITEPSFYNNNFSSKGLVIKVKLKTGNEVLCYLINGYDAAGTLTWKDANTCP